MLLVRILCLTAGDQRFGLADEVKWALMKEILSD